jgi:hypothetical protein
MAASVHLPKRLQQLQVTLLNHGVFGDPPRHLVPGLERHGRGAVDRVARLEVDADVDRTVPRPFVEDKRKVQRRFDAKEFGTASAVAAFVVVGGFGRRMLRFAWLVRLNEGKAPIRVLQGPSVLPLQ